MPEGLLLGSGYISILPSWDEWGSAVDAQFTSSGSAAGTKFGTLMAQGLETTAGEAGSGAGAKIAESLATTGSEAGSKLGSGIAEGLNSTATEAATSAGAKIAETLDTTATETGSKMGQAISEGLSTGGQEGATKLAQDVEAAGEKGKETASGLGTAFSTAGEKGGEFSEKLLGNMQMAGVSLGPVGEGINQLTMATQGLGEKWTELESPIEKVGAGIAVAGGALTAIGAMAIEASDSTEKAEAGLENAVKNTGGSYEDLKPKIDDVVKSEANHGVSISQTYQSLQTLIQATGNSKSAVADMTTVDNLAAATHVSLTAATKQVVQALQGKGRALTALGIVSQGHVMTATQEAAAEAQISKATDAVSAALDKQHMAVEAVTIAQDKLNAKGGDTLANQLAYQKAEETAYQDGVKYNELNTTLKNDQDKLTASQHAGADAMQQINEKTKGAADALANTFGGHLDAIKTKIGNFVAEEGAKFGKWMELAGPALMGVGAAMDVGTKIVGHFAQGASEAAEAGDAMATATEGATVATEALSVAEDAEAVSEGIALGPILLIIAAVAAVGIAIYELVTHWHEVWGDIKQYTEDAVGDVIGFFEAIPHFFEELPGKILSLLADVPSWLEHTGEDLLKGLVTGAVKGLIDLEIWFGELELKILEKLGDAALWLLKTGVDVLHGMLTGLGEGLEDIIIWSIQLAPKVIEAVGDATIWLFDTGVKAIEGLLSGAVTAFGDVVSFAEAAPGRVLAALGDAGSWLTDVGTKAIEGLLTALQSGFMTVLTFAEAAPGKIVTALGDAGSWLVDTGTKAIEGLLSALENGFQAVIAFAQATPRALVAALGDAGSWLLDVGTKAAKGLLTTFEDGVAAVVTFAESIPGKVVAALGDAGSWLLSSGKAIIEGLWNGIKNEAAALPGQIEGLIKSIIPDKIAKVLGIGSPSKVTTEFGANVMQGLAGGMVNNTHLVADATSGAIGAITGGLTGIQGPVASIPVSAAVGGGVGSAAAAAAGASNVTIAPGAVVLQFTGPVDSAAIPQVQAVVTQAHQDLLNEIKRRSPRAA